MFLFCTNVEAPIMQALFKHIRPGSSYMGRTTTQFALGNITLVSFIVVSRILVVA